MKYKYIERWEAARQSQNLLRCRYAEMELEQKLETVTNQCKNEIRVHDEIRKFLILEEQVIKVIIK